MKMRRMLALMLFGVVLGLGLPGRAYAGLAGSSAAERLMDLDFDWSTATYDPTNGGFCNAAGWCAAPQSSLPPEWTAYCQSQWCAYPSNALCFEMGFCGGSAGEGRSCDWLPENCFVPIGGVTPPSSTECVGRNWAICDYLGGDTPGEEPEECPLDLAVSQPAPLVTAAKLAPAYPVVVGQDVEARGVDLAMGVQVFPVTVSYNTWVEVSEHVCVWYGDGTRGGCSQRGYDNILGNNGVWESWMIGHPDWAEEDQTRRECQRITRVYADRIGSLSIRAELADESIDWITKHLAGIYPGAHVHQAEWSLWPSQAPAPVPASGGLSAHRTSFAVTYEGIPFMDPGQYYVNIAGWTTGTYFSAPRRISFDDIVFTVDVKLTALTK